MTDNNNNDEISDIDRRLLAEQEEYFNSNSNSISETGFKGGGNGHNTNADEEFEPPIENKNEDEKLSNGNTKIQSAADILVELATDNAKSLFKDQYGTAYAQVYIADHDEIIRVEGNKFKRFLARLFYNGVRKKVVNAESITNAVQVLQAKAEYEGQTIPLCIRAAWNGGNIYYDMSNQRWQCVKISEQGWE
jgi:hypothetical protein